MPDRILVPLDGSPLAESILPPVVQIAKGLNIPVTLLHLIPASAFPSGHDPRHRVTVNQLVADERGRAGQYLIHQRGLLEAQGVTVRAEVGIADHVAERIVEIAQAEGDSLIAMSTHGRTGLARLVAGSVTDKVLHIATVPLLVLRPREKVKPGPFERIIVPLDQSPLAEQALAHAEHLARELKLPLLLLYVQAPVAMNFSDPTTGGYYPAYEEIEKEAEQSALAYLEAQSRALRSRGLTVEAALRNGVPAQQIADAAQEGPQSLIVMSTHGRSGLGRAVLGSVAGTVVRQSGVPVYLVRAKE